MPWSPMLLIAGSGLIILMMVMFGLWLLHLRMRNAGVVDAGWAGGLAFLAILYAVGGNAPVMRRLCLAIIVALAAGRLTWHILRRLSQEGGEDGRYQSLRASWQRHQNLKFLFFFLFQALLDVLLALPFLLIAFNPLPMWHPLDLLALMLWMLGFVGESVADAQLSAFKRRSTQTGQVCQRGLWYYSRHPNYFCQWLMWVAYALWATATPAWGWLGWASPVIMLYFLLFVTGIPPTERQSLASRGEAYRQYMRTTSAFVPWFKKNA